MSVRTLKQTIHAIPTTDGGGVKLLRSLGQSPRLRLDPFLMLDEFFSTNAEDYIASFPDHPHRGFETVTYMMKGGAVQWVTAGRGHHPFRNAATGKRPPARFSDMVESARPRGNETGRLPGHSA